MKESRSNSFIKANAFCNFFHNTPFFKPDWSPELLLSMMYIGHFGVYRRSLVKQVGGFRKGYEGSQDHDLALRCSEQAKCIAHIPRILYHWQQHGGSTAGDISQKPYVMKATKRTLKDALKRRELKGTVHNGLWMGSYRTHFKIGNPLISIIIPFRDQADVLKACLESIEAKTTYRNYELILVDNESSQTETHDFLEKITQRKPWRGCRDIRVLSYPHPFNFSSINNFAAKQAKGEMLLFLNNDTEVIEPTWIEAMIEHAQRPEIGAVGVTQIARSNMPGW